MQDNFLKNNYFFYNVGTLLRKLTLKSIDEALTTFKESSRTVNLAVSLCLFFIFSSWAEKNLLEFGILI